MTKKTILVLTIIVALIIALYKWLTSDNEEQKQPVEETKAATSEKENVNGKAEEATTEDKVNETINK